MTFSLLAWIGKKLAADKSQRCPRNKKLEKSSKSKPSWFTRKEDKMSEGRELWKKYCGFFDKSFSEQVEYNERKKKEYFERWKKTKMAKQLCPEGVEKFEDIPLTTYDNYPILHEFGKKIEKLEKTVPRGKKELLCDYYDRIGRQASPMLDGWMVDDYGFCMKTSGTTGESKWFVFGDTFFKNMATDIMAILTLCCSDSWGETTLRKGDSVLNLMSSSPYSGGPFYRAVLNAGLRLVPPLSVTDNIPNMRKKIYLTLKMIEKGKSVDVAGGIASSFHLICRYFTNRAGLYKDQYQSMNLGVVKLVLFLRWLLQRITGSDYKKVKDVMPVKGVGAGGFDTELYRDYLTDQFGREPLNVYGTTDIGFPMMGLPDRRKSLMPDLRSGYFEFTENGELVCRIDELKKMGVYGLIASPFGSMHIRYQIGDLFKVVDFRDDGLPIFEFESRKSSLLDIYGWCRLSEAIAIEALKKAGLPPTDKWAFVKVIEPNEHLCLLMEKEWEHSEEKVAKLVFDSLKEIDVDFHHYVRHFKIKKVSDVIKVEYLKKGTFMRYVIKKSKEGVPLGQIKPPKLIPPERLEIVEMLKGA